MSIRNVAKGIVVDGDRLLLTKCMDSNGRSYYALPGGGQAQYETIEEALVRECLEETGYSVTPVRFAALYEEIVGDAELRRTYPDYTHKIHHIFLCRLADETSRTPTELDLEQVGLEWLDVGAIDGLDLRPVAVRDRIQIALRDPTPAFLGSQRMP